jgi:hypothetical protein
MFVQLFYKLPSSYRRTFCNYKTYIYSNSYHFELGPNLKFGIGL